MLAFCFALDASDGDFMNDSHPAHIDLQVMARQIMLEHGFEPDLPATVQEQPADIKVAAAPPVEASFRYSSIFFFQMVSVSVPRSTSRNIGLTSPFDMISK